MRSQKRAAARGRHETLIRVLGVLRALSDAAGVDVYQLAAEAGATVRTIRRDLDAIQAAHIPLVSARDGKRVRWRIGYADKASQLATLLNAMHYLSLRVAMDQGGVVRSSSSIFSTLEDLGQKIEAALGPKGRAELKALDACFHSYERRLYQESAREFVWPLVKAIAEHRVCRVTYRAPRAEPRDKIFEILPLRIFAYDGALYVMCHVRKHDALGTLHLKRIRALKLLDERADAPKDFDPTVLENAAFGVMATREPTTYRLRFHRDVAPYIRERTWHPTQTLVELRGGAVELAFRCGASHEVTAWVASWGEGVEVLEPVGLRREMRGLGAWLLETYRDRAQPPRRGRTPPRSRHARGPTLRR